MDDMSLKKKYIFIKYDGWDNIHILCVLLSLESFVCRKFLSNVKLKRKCQLSLEPPIESQRPGRMTKHIQ